MQKHIASQFGIFTTRTLVALALCSSGVLLGIFSLAASPLETTRTNPKVPLDFANFQGTFAGNANRPGAVATLAKEALLPGVPVPSGDRVC
jgi:hypothetical protein